MLNILKFVFCIPIAERKERKFKIKPAMVTPDKVVVETRELRRHLGFD